MSIGEARTRPPPKLVAVGSGSTDNEVDSEGRDFLSGGFNEALNTPFGCMI